MCGSRDTFASKGPQVVKWFAGGAPVKPNDVRWISGAEFKRAFPSEARGFSYDFMKLIPVVDNRDYAVGAIGSSVRPITRRVIFVDTDKPTKCGAMCRNAKGPMCDCSCKGENHGASVAMSRARFAELDLKPTAEMAANAARGLELREKHGKGGTAVGVARARDIKNRANLSPSTVKRMHSFFSRHEGNQAGGEDDAGYIAWLLWGGDAGKAWAARKSEQLGKSESARFSHDIRLPKGNRRLNIDEAHAALAQMGYRLGTVRYDPAAGGSVYKVTQPNGSVIDMPAAKLTDFIYEKAKHMKSGTKAAMSENKEQIVHSFGDGWQVVQRHDGYSGHNVLVLQRIPAQGHQSIRVSSIAEAKTKHDAITNWVFRATVAERKPNEWVIQATAADGGYGLGGRGGKPFPSAQKAREELSKMQDKYRKKAGMSRAGAKAAFSESAAWIAKYLPALNQWWRDRTDHPTDLDASSDRWEIEGVLDDVAEHCREAVPREAKPSWYAAALRDVKKIPHARKAHMKTKFAAEVIQKLSGGWVIEREGGILYLAKGSEAIPVPSVERALELHKASVEGRLARRTGGFMSRAGAKAAFGDDKALASFLKKWKRNEADNAHTENVVMLAQFVGSSDEIAEARDIQRQHDAIGHLPSALNTQRYALYKNLKSKLLARYPNAAFSRAGAKAAFERLSPYIINELGHAQEMAEMDGEKAIAAACAAVRANPTMENLKAHPLALKELKYKLDIAEDNSNRSAVRSLKKALSNRKAAFAHPSWSAGLLGKETAPQLAAYSWIDAHLGINGHRTQMLLADIAAEVHARNPALSIQQAIMKAAQEMVQKGVATYDIRALVEDKGWMSRAGAKAAFGIMSEIQDAIDSGDAIEARTLLRKYGSGLSKVNREDLEEQIAKMSRAGAKSTHATDNMYYTVAAHIGDQPAGERTTKSLDEAKAYAKAMLAALKPNAKGKPLVVDVYPVVNYSPQASVLSLKASRTSADSNRLTLAQRIAVEHDAKRMANR